MPEIAPGYGCWAFQSFILGCLPFLVSLCKAILTDIDHFWLAFVKEIMTLSHFRFVWSFTSVVWIWIGICLYLDFGIRKECADKYFMCYFARVDCLLKPYAARAQNMSKVKSYYMRGCAGDMGDAKDEAEGDMWKMIVFTIIL